MSSIEELQIQVQRMQAMLTAHEHLLLAIFEALPTQEVVLSIFEEQSQTFQDLLLIEPEFTDEELADGDTARSMILRSLRLSIRHKLSRSEDAESKK